MIMQDSVRPESTPPHELQQLFAYLVEKLYEFPKEYQQTMLKNFMSEKGPIRVQMLNDLIDLWNREPAKRDIPMVLNNYILNVNGTDIHERIHVENERLNAIEDALKTIKTEIGL